MSKKKKTVVVNRQFLMNLADYIYNPKDGTFLRLCDGTLQNGPDPTNKERPMHCGLGELYFAMTGKQPKETHASETDVIDKAVDLSTLPNLEEEARNKADAAGKAIKKLMLPGAVEERLLDAIDENDFLDEDDTSERDFRAALDDIPTKNDDGCGDSQCGVKAYQRRSRRVAHQLRKAARLLP